MILTWRLLYSLKIFRPSACSYVLKKREFLGFSRCKAVILVRIACTDLQFIWSVGLYTKDIYLDFHIKTL